MAEITSVSITHVPRKESQDNTGIVIEFDSFDAGKDVLIRHYYPKTSLLKASLGSISPVAVGGIRVTDEIEEWLNFSNSDTASTQYPAASDVKFELFGSAFNQELKTQNVSIHFDGEKFVASQACYADIRVTYKSEYILLRYSPGIRTSAAGNPEYTYGVVYSSVDGKFGKFTVPQPNPPESLEMEYARVVSTYLAGSADSEYQQYEKPRGYPEYLSYGGGLGEAPAPDECAEVKRVHATVILNGSGRTYSIHHVQPTHHPYGGSYTWNPEYTLELAGSPSNGISHSVFNRVDKAGLIANLRDKYQGLKV